MTSNDIAHQFLLFSHMLADKFITVKNNHIKNIVQNTHDWNTSLTIQTVLLVEREHRRLIKFGHHYHLMFKSKSLQDLHQPCISTYNI